LTERNNRLKDGDPLGDFCHNARTGVVRRDLLDAVNARLCHDVEEVDAKLAAADCDKALWLAPTNALCDEVNRDRFQRLVRQGKPHVLVWAQHHPAVLRSKNAREIPPASGQKRYQLLSRIVDDHDKDKKLSPAALHLASGSRVALSYNVDTQNLLYQGATGTVIRWAYRGAAAPPEEGLFTQSEVCAKAVQPEVPMVFVQMDRMPIDPTTGVEFTCDPNVPRLVPFVGINSDTKLQREYYRMQLPLREAFCRTIHKAQGITADFGVVILPSDLSMKNAPFTMGLEYVAVSRAKRLDRIWLLNPLSPGHIAPQRHAERRRAVADFYSALRSEKIQIAPG